MRTHRTAQANCLLPRAVALAVLLSIAACDSDRNAEEMEARTPEPTIAATPPPQPTGDTTSNAKYSLVESATAEITSTSLGNVEGAVTFTAGEDGQGMRVNVALEGLQPGHHGFHIHELGDCSADDASSAGGHFNPQDHSHGSPSGAEHHVGDMGNIEADGNGRVNTQLTLPSLAFSGPASILQKAVVIHSDRDDLESDPAGNSGDRVGCGVIRIDLKVLAG